MRALARWGITPLLAAPLGAWALGLGDIELQSALNQPFQAEILLVSATPEEVEGLRIGLATRETFEQRGLDRPDFLSSLEFRVAKDRSGRDVVRITSRAAIAEPFVTMLIEAAWSRGRSLKEYTVLLDPPVLLPGPAVPAAVQPAQTRPADSNAPGGAIDRPAPAPDRPAPVSAPVSPQRQPARQPAPGPSSNATPAPAPSLPAQSPGGSYGPVQRAETLWRIAERFRPEGVSMNQMMVAVFEANPQAFAGNMNLLQIGAVLRIPEAVDLQTVARTAATAEVQRQTDEWQGRAQRRLILVPPTEPGVAATSPAAGAGADNAQARQSPGGAQTPAAGAEDDVEASRRLLEVRDQELQNLQERLGAEQAPVAAPPEAAEPEAAPGVDLEPEPLFADESEAPEAVPPVAEPAAPVATPRRIIVEPESSWVSQILDWVAMPLVWIVLGVGALVLAGLWYVRRRRQEPEGMTGRWNSLESDVEDDGVRETAARVRRGVPDESFVVEEQAARPRRAELAVDLDEDEPRPSADDTLSSQTVINLDQADPVAEADFHMAYGLYDQAAELVSKALQAAPDRRDLKLKLLEVFFVWGNKDAFLSAAKGLRKEIGQRPDADWDKVVIMGKQICPDAPLFTDTIAAAGRFVDLDLDPGTSPALDFAFEDPGSGEMDLDLTDGADADVDTESSAERRAKQARTATHRPKDRGDMLEIGARTAAGLEAAMRVEEENGRTQTTSDLDITQESPTIETPRSGRDSGSRFGTESPTAEFTALDAPTVETPTLESAGSEAPTMKTPYRGAELPTVEQPGIAAGTSDLTAEIDLDDLGLDVDDLEGLPGDLGDLPAAAGGETDTREQAEIDQDDELLSATGVTQVLRTGRDESEQRETADLADEDATMLASSFDADTLRGTEVVEHRFEFDESGDTSFDKSSRRDDSLDLNLDDLSAALQGGDTVEQPRSSSFSADVFGGNGQTAVDLDIGREVAGTDDPTGTAEVSPLDPQTMTEVGTKLDLARAYIDMGDPEGARSILEEVLDEGDPTQRREAQSLIDVLGA